MKAATFSEFGGSEVIEARELLDPVANDGQVLVAVEAASINPVDVIVRSGAMAARMPAGAAPPHVLGWDLAGHIVAVGTGVDASLVGTYVVGFVPWFADGNGAQAALVALGPQQWTPAPDSLAPAELTTLGLNALTAYQVVASIVPDATTTVLVTGAPGAVGGYAVELAARTGATVWAMASDDDAEAVTRFGAARVLPRDAAATIEELDGAAVDVLIDTASLGDTILAAVRDGGRFVTVSVPPEAERDVDVTRIGVSASAADLAEIVGLAAAGDLTTRVDTTFPVDSAREAYAYFESGSHRGRVVLTF